jgi:hypothetical protein
MTPLARGLALAGLHALLVCSFGAKLFYDRATRPRVWARAAPFDPDSLFRGRYVSLTLEVSTPTALGEREEVELGIAEGRLVAQRTTESTGLFVTGGRLDEPIAFFIPEHVDDPSRRGPGEQLWAEVTLPGHGPPRPIRLGVKKQGGEITPLEF